jgi:deazaflavin-dependent oxidoreductase (nitroreductase family)
LELVKIYTPIVESINLMLVKIYTPIVKSILRSPLHGLLSKHTLLITFTGQKSGKAYTTPVGYIRNGDGITVFSRRHSTWWRNLRGGAPVTVRVKGQDLKAIGESIEDKKAVAAGLLAYTQKLPHYAKFFMVTLDPDGQPNPAEVARAAQNRVMIRVQLAKGPIGA